MGIEPLYSKLRMTCNIGAIHLLRGPTFDRSNQVYAMDIAYIPIARGCMSLAAVLNGYSCKVLFWRVSITMDAHLCIEALAEAIVLHGPHQIMSTDRGRRNSTPRSIIIITSGLTLG